MTTATNAFQLVLRLRPGPETDSCHLKAEPGESRVKIDDSAFTVDYLFLEQTTQQVFYDTTFKKLVAKMFQGRGITLLAYGPPGSGKNYTLHGPKCHGGPDQLGVIPRAVEDIFAIISLEEDKFIFKVNVSFMELYQEKCYDLLSGKERAHSIIQIREHEKAIILPGITELTVTSTTETMKALERGFSGRMTAPTAMNRVCSRSHAVFTITISKESRTDKNLATTSKFRLVDLAGSERLKEMNTSREWFKEGVKINQSLLALGIVTSALAEGNKRSYISYRDNKLTRLLQDSLGGNCLTLMVVCVSPADCNLEETVSTLRWADGARRVHKKPVVNRSPRAAELASKVERDEGEGVALSEDRPAVPALEEESSAVGQAPIINVELAVERASDAGRDSAGPSRCSCHGSCTSRKCSCVKAGAGCGGRCRCVPRLCRNRPATSATASSENTDCALLTPRARRAANRERRRTVNLGRANSPASGDSGGPARCGCYGNCTNKKCSCVKAGADCGDRCRCMPGACRNRPTSTEDNTGQPESFPARTVSRRRTCLW